MKSPSEVLIKCMENFGEAEPEKILIIYYDEEGWVKWRSNELAVHEQIGMMRVVEHALLADRKGE